DSVLLSCQALDYSFETYGVRWYRQAPGGKFEWVSYISYDCSIIKLGQSLEGRGTVSRDNSRLESSLDLRALHPRDSACYFCAV
ncbi:Ig heavy chain V-III region HIL, partial [Antrostomus carolinensis]